jgi:hypothetical protein
MLKLSTSYRQTNKDMGFQEDNQHLFKKSEETENKNGIREHKSEICEYNSTSTSCRSIPVPDFSCSCYSNGDNY